ncbi:molybdopterin-binding protein [Pseudooceanicola sp. C21-150M6]|uniref:molybdopterin-binding protein n=1 Tax=Pseudooceanicola sp. C21-150M6 TaxID=3434355 RepID=UPI003D7FCF0B
MKFGPVSLDQAEGAILAHSVTLTSGRLRKGQRLEASHLQDMAGQGMTQVICARLDPGDVEEDTAAARIAAALVPDPAGQGLRITPPFTGRVNLLADGPGVIVLDPDTLTRLNHIDPMLTLATVPAFQQLAAGGMAATVKIISYAVPETSVTAAEALLAGSPALHLARPALRTARLVVTEIPGGAGEKGVTAVKDRLTALGLSLTSVSTTPHTVDRLGEELARDAGDDLTLILTGSATSDPHDVAPEAVRRAGGAIDRFGMPVDPGNLLFLGQLHGRPVIGLPGCARSPALNGADWILSRIACGLTVTGGDISDMGVGGLLKEIPTRPQPRESRRAARPAAGAASAGAGASGDKVDQS